MSLDGHSERSLRLTGLMRGLIITYGIAGVTWLTSLGKDSHVAGTNAVTFFAIGVALQLLLLLVKWLTRRSPLAPQAMYIAELLADGVAVLLFAIATFRAISPGSAADL